ncbi:uncharacterized protein A4U43_C06F11200 [Asparagus officinalis]|uniref:aldehyde oxygenase (deformylating) n=1 Tax=Asparagus officinalis TaxID=4686 RepID=A0A5P1ELQ5_ASPOF|nr:uncharacterized protein A4U43_C06F11200 [Asparagus officinalis]
MDRAVYLHRFTEETDWYNEVVLTALLPGWAWNLSPGPLEPGLANEPLDGLLSASPHVMCLFLIPTHFVTHVALIFIETLWTTNIHDCIHGDIWPIMGAGYHTIHHTTYRHNYGHFTILMDWMFGTLRYPEEEANKAR